MKTYLVKGKSRFRGYSPGETFTGRLDPSFEVRAIARGSIEIVEPHVKVELDATRAVLPRGWVDSIPERSTA